jgi:hypothetical protein
MSVKAPRLPESLVDAISLPGDNTYNVLKKLVLLGVNLGGYIFSILLSTLYVLSRLALPAIFANIYLVVVAQRIE